MENDSFKFDPDVLHLNVAVGSKLFGSNEYAYMIGFSQAIEVLMAAADNESYFDPYTGDSRGVYMDALVYPICFCARHFIELFLKRQIRAVSALQTGIPASVNATHKLIILWDELKTHLAMDMRLQEIGAPLEEFVKDFAAIDAEGEAFRYCQDKNGKLHLDSLEHINLHVLGNRLKELMSLAETFEARIEPLQREYELKTTTDGLSREQILEIAKRLPAHETWKNGALDSVKQKILQEFRISSTVFGRALKIIKTHRGFSHLIGFELPLPGLSPDVFMRLKTIADGHDTVSSISDDEWFRLESVLQVGRLDSYSEEYDPFVVHFSGHDRRYPLDRGHIMRAILSKNNRFRIGLRKLGQKTLLTAFNTLIPEEPALHLGTSEDL